MSKVKGDVKSNPETDEDFVKVENGEEDAKGSDSCLRAGASGETSSNFKLKQRDRTKNVLGTELVTILLPEIYFHIGVLVSENPHCAVEVLEFIRSILLPLINVQQLSSPAYKEDVKTYNLVVESSHPYKQATVESYKASFPPSVKWMLIEFSSKSQTGQVEDFLQLYLTKPDQKKAFPVLNKMSQDNNWPQDALLLPGNELVFSLETASDYTNSRDQKPHLFYGFRCVVTGYEIVPLSQDHDGSHLVNVLVNTAGLASTLLMKVHQQLWLDDENTAPPSGESKKEKIEHLRAIESSAAVTLERHSALFLPGLHLDFFPSSSQGLNGNLPISEGSKEKLFLQDFVSAAEDTTGGRLARWLQPDPYIDPKQCLLHLNTKSLVHTLPASVTIVTRDQYGNPAYVPTLKVELSAKPQPSAHVDLTDGSRFAADSLPSRDPSPVFETRFEVTKYRESRYHTITMMRPYKEYSFEELRIAYPLKRTLKTENILVAHVSQGTYRATWIPCLAATYTLQVTLDQQLRGPRQLVTVADAPLGSTDPPAKPIDPECRLLRFATENSRGLRIRTSPTLQSKQIGLLKYNDVIEYHEQVQNHDGTWVKLAKASIISFCGKDESEGWCISFHKHNGRTFLVPVENKDKKLSKVNKKSNPKPGVQSVDEGKKLVKVTCKPSTSGRPSVSKQTPHPDVPAPSAFSKGTEPLKTFSDTFSLSPLNEGALQWKEKVPGEYKVAKCGKSGHNIRYNPSLKATPIGKLVMGNVFMAMSVKRNKSGIWLLLHKSSLSQFCEEIPDDRHAWTLAVSRGGTEYLQLKEIVESSALQGLSKQSRTVDPADEASNSKININTTPPVGGQLLNIFEDRSSVREEALEQMTDLVKPIPSSEAAKNEPIEDAKMFMKIWQESSKKITEKEIGVKKGPHWELKHKHYHHRSSSESDVTRRNAKKSGTNKNGEGRPGRGKGVIHNSRSACRSHSNPGEKRRTSLGGVPSSKPMSSRKSLVELQTVHHPGKDSGVKVPPGKTLRGGIKKVSKSPSQVNGVTDDDIPFIDDVIDAEGNILSPVKENPNGVDSEKDKQKTEESEGKELKKEECPRTVNATRKSKMRKEKHMSKRKPLQSSTGSPTAKPTKASDSVKTISPLVAECSRAVFAAFLWHEGIVHDAMACASFLKFNHTERSQVLKYVNAGVSSTKDNCQQRRLSVSTEDELMMSDVDPAVPPPDTLVHLAMFWDRLSETITKIAVKNQSLPIPTPVNQNLNCHGDKAPPTSKVSKRYSVDAVANGFNDAERKAVQRNYQPIMPLMQARRNAQQHMMPYFQPQQLQVNAEAGDHFKDTACDLCDKVHPYPITYHMKQAHPGCGKFAGGLGYNSSGHYCGGWAGDCGDGGVGGSTWYLLCVVCREKYMSRKSAAVPAKRDPPASKSSGTWTNRLHHLLTLPTNAHQVMKDNAMFLLNLVSASASSPLSYEQRLESGSAKLEILHDDPEIDDQKIWDLNSLLPLSTCCHCPFPAIPCAYLAKHGKENGINNNIRPRNAPNTRTTQEYRNRSLSNQTTPSSGQFKHFYAQRLSMTPDSTSQKTESILLQHRSRLLRSVSTGSHPHRRRACSGGDVSPSGGSTGSFLLHNPSASMKRLMHGKSGNSNNIARDAVHGSHVMTFVTQRHDLKSVHITLQMTLRRAAIRVYVLQALTWLLRTVVSEPSIHDILWYFVSALAGSSSTNKNNDEQKNADNEVADDEIEETKSLYDHPVKDMLNAGIHSMMPLVEAFHGFLQTVSDIMMDLPPNSPVQLMAIRCWSLRVLPSDHQFLHKSKVFSHISQILSKVDSKAARTPQHKLVKVVLNQQNQTYEPISEALRDRGKVTCLCDITSKVQIKTSSHSSIANSLTDGSTETFWESGDEDKNKTKHITIDLAGVGHCVIKLLIHIDNTRDLQKKVTSVVLLAEVGDEWARDSNKDLDAQYVGWLMFVLPESAAKLKIELRGPDNGLRVRQVKLLGDPSDGAKQVEQLPSQVLRAQTCEAELLKVFKLLTAEVFGQLLSEQQPPTSKSRKTSPPSSNPDSSEKTDPPEVEKSSSSVPVSPRDVDPNLREHMVGILFSRSKLTSLQKKVFEHTVQALHTEAGRIKEVWEASLEPAAQHAPLAKVQEGDIYCFELLSMLLALSGSNVGYRYMAQQSVLIKDFISLLHTGTPRVQRQITLLFRRILSEVTPSQLADVLSARIPSQDKLTDSSPTSETPTVSSSSSSELVFGVLDPFFACIAKALSVQVKGMQESFSNNAESKPKKTCSLKLQTSFPGRPEVDSSTWWMHGSMQDRSTVEAIIKLLVDMSANEISPAWSSVTKCAVSEAILALTRLSEVNREPENCLKNATLWQALASLCVLDRDHVDKLTSARSTQNKTNVVRLSESEENAVECIGKTPLQRVCTG